MTAWLDVRDADPALDGEDYGAWLESREVLVTDGRTVYVARMSRDRRDDARPGLKPERTWRLQGRDGYTLEGVTHWRPLPALPGAPNESPAVGGVEGAE